MAYAIADWVTRPIQAGINHYRQQWQLPALKGLGRYVLSTGSDQPNACSIGLPAYIVTPDCFTILVPFAQYPHNLLPSRLSSSRDSL